MTKLGLIPFVLLAVVTGCKDNSQYCEGNPGNNCQNMWDASGCSTSAQCSGATPVCDVGARTCVQCTTSEATACTGTTPVCGTSQTCEACTTHAQCSASSNVCLPSGACADSAQVAYVSPTGTDNTTCTKVTPCTVVAKALATNRPYVKLTGTTNEQVTVTDKTVTFLADPGAKLTSTSNGVILAATGASDLKIYDLEISGASGTGVGLSVGGTSSVAVTRSTFRSNQAGGISASAGSLSVTQSTVESNPGGGILISGTGTTFAITNNVIVYNGTANGANASQPGGLLITSNTTGAKVEWNTIAFNQSDGTIYRGGITCSGSMVSAAGNLIFRNSESDGAGGLKTDANTQKSTGCVFGNSLALASDASNLGFKSPATQPFDFHLTAASPTTVVNAGGACTGVDLDGDTRPVGTACDLGADEYKP